MEPIPRSPQQPIMNLRALENPNNVQKNVYFGAKECFGMLFFSLQKTQYCSMTISETFTWLEVMNFAFFISHVLKKGGHNRKEVAYARSYSKIVVLGMHLGMWVRKTLLGQNTRG